MAITATYLVADITASDTTITVNSGTGFPGVGSVANPGYIVRINGEWMKANAQPVAGTIKVVRRGDSGTAAVAHDKLSKVEVSSTPADFAQAPAGSVTSLPPFLPVYETIGESITFTAAQVAGWGNRDRIFAITMATAVAIVLPAPSKAQDGLRITFTPLTAVLHVVTATALLANGGAASPYATATKAQSTVGGDLVLMAENGVWSVTAAVNWTIA